MPETKQVYIKSYGNEEELAKHLPDLSKANAEEIAIATAQILNQCHATDIQIIDVRGKSDVTDFYVLATAQSGIQVQSISGTLEFLTTEKGLPPVRKEDLKSRVWAVLDYSSVLVHIMFRESREFYNIEKLYADADRIIPVESAEDTAL
jgi:ribosome-associated protein